MKNAALCTLILMFFATVSFALPGKGDPAPDFDWVSSSGSKASLSQLRGQVVIIDFFAVWCASCRQLTTFLVDLEKRSKVKIIGLNVDELKEKQTAAYIREKGITYPIIQADEKLQQKYGVKSLPLLYIIGKDGRISGMFQGFSNDIAKSIERLVTSTK